MSQTNTVTSSSKRPYRKGNRLTGIERQQAFIYGFSQFKSR
ncbi:RepB family protein [Xenorhabdus sp. PB30.3]|nr:hypothetical protein [Xenorhabdus sp. PB30.3]